MKNLNKAFMLTMVGLLAACGGAKKQKQVKVRDFAVALSGIYAALDEAYPEVPASFSYVYDYDGKMELTSGGETQTSTESVNYTLYFDSAKGLGYFSMSSTEDGEGGLIGQDWFQQTGENVTIYEEMGGEKYSYEYSNAGVADVALTYLAVYCEYFDDYYLGDYDFMLSDEAPQLNPGFEWKEFKSYYGSDNEESVYAEEKYEMHATNVTIQTGIVGNVIEKAHNVFEIKDMILTQKIYEIDQTLDLTELGMVQRVVETTSVTFKGKSGKIPSFNPADFPAEGIDE